MNLILRKGKISLYTRLTFIGCPLSPINISISVADRHYFKIELEYNQNSYRLFAAKKESPFINN